MIKLAPCAPGPPHELTLDVRDGEPSPRIDRDAQLAFNTTTHD